MANFQLLALRRKKYKLFMTGKYPKKKSRLKLKIRVLHHENLKNTDQTHCAPDPISFHSGSNMNHVAVLFAATNKT